MTEQSKETLRDHALRFDNFLEDAFGLNVKGLRSIGTLIANPSRYFDAASTTDWANKFTPSVRLWFSLIALTFFFKFLWADRDAASVQAIVLQIEQANWPLPNGVTPQMAAESLAQWWFAYLPFTNLFLLFLVGAIWPFWGRPMSLAMRARYIYAIVIPSSVLGLFTTLSLAWLPVEMFFWYYVVSLLALFAVDALTAWRGLFHCCTIGERFLRSASLAFATLIVAFFSSISAQSFAFITIKTIY